MNIDTERTVTLILGLILGALLILNITIFYTNSLYQRDMDSRIAQMTADIGVIKAKVMKGK